MTMVDPTLAALCKAVYGDTVDPVELSKALDPSEVHIDDSMSRRPRRGPAIAVGPRAPELSPYARRRRTGKRTRVLPPAGHGEAWRGEPKETYVSRPAGGRRPYRVSKLAGAPAEKSRRKKLLAAGLLAGAAAEATAAKDTVPALIRGVKQVRAPVREASGVRAKAKAMRPLVVGENVSPMVPGHPILPVAMGPGTRSAQQVANFAVGLGAARELLPRKKQPVEKGMGSWGAHAAEPHWSVRALNRPFMHRPLGRPRGKHAKTPPTLHELVHHPAVRDAAHIASAKSGQAVGGAGFHAPVLGQVMISPHEVAEGMETAIEGIRAPRAAGRHRKVNKALRLRLRPINPGAVVRTPSLKARRPAGAPRNVGKAYTPFRKTRKFTADIRQTAEQANRASREAAEVGSKVKRLIPSPKAAGAVLGGTVLASTAGSGLASYYGTKRGVRAGMSKTFTATGQIAKRDEDQHLVFGWASVSELGGEPVVDRQGDIIPIEELEKAAYDYVLDCRIGGDQHARLGKDVSTEWGPRQTGTLVESMVFTPDKIAKMGLPEDFPKAWWVGIHVDDEPTWQAIKKGERTGFSVHGRGKRDALFGMSKAAEHLERVSQAAHELYPGGQRHRDFGARLKTLQSAVIDAHHAGHSDKEISAATRAPHPAGTYEHYLPARIRDIHQSATYFGHLRKGERTENLKRRTKAAVRPPAVTLVPVRSSAIRAMGYQPQSRRLAYAMNSRPDAPYTYKATPRQAAAAQSAQSLGRHYATEVRGKYPRKEKATVIDRARLFANPPEQVGKADDQTQPRRRDLYGQRVAAMGSPGTYAFVNARKGHRLRAIGREVGESAAGGLIGTAVGAGAGKLTRFPRAGQLVGAHVGGLIGGSAGALHAARANQRRGYYLPPQRRVNKSAFDYLEPSVQTRRRRAQQIALGSQLAAGTVGVGFGASKLRDAFKEEHPAAFEQGTRAVGQRLVRRGVAPATAERVVRTLRTGKPGFKPLVAAGTAGLLATGAHRYLQVSQIHGEKKPKTPAAAAATGLGAQALF